MLGEIKIVPVYRGIRGIIKRAAALTFEQRDQAVRRTVTVRMSARWRRPSVITLIVFPLAVRDRGCRAAYRAGPQLGTAAKLRLETGGNREALAGAITDRS